jgi:hypothetical protein
MNTKHRPDLFVHTLNSLRTGAAEDASNELAEAIQAARDTGKVATVTVTLKIKPETGMSGIFDIQEEVKSKLPQMPRGRTIMFETPDGNLVTDDPNQQDLPLRSVDMTEEKTELKQVGS